MPDIIFICVRVEDMPEAEAEVPSRRERCKECGAEVWMSRDIKTDGYICVTCAAADGSIVPRIHPQVRENLRAMGWTDDEIERVHEFSTAAMGPRKEG